MQLKWHAWVAASACRSLFCFTDHARVGSHVAARVLFCSCMSLACSCMSLAGSKTGGCHAKLEEVPIWVHGMLPQELEGRRAATAGEQSAGARSAHGAAMAQAGTLRGARDGGLSAQAGAAEPAAGEKCAQAAKPRDTVTAPKPVQVRVIAACDCFCGTAVRECSIAHHLKRCERCCAPCTLFRHSWQQLLHGQCEWNWGKGTSMCCVCQEEPAKAVDAVARLDLVANPLFNDGEELAQQPCDGGSGEATAGVNAQSQGRAAATGAERSAAGPEAGAAPQAPPCRLQVARCATSSLSVLVPPPSCPECIPLALHSTMMEGALIDAGISAGHRCAQGAGEDQEGPRRRCTGERGAQWAGRACQEEAAVQEDGCNGHLRRGCCDRTQIRCVPDMAPYPCLATCAADVMPKNWNTQRRAHPQGRLCILPLALLETLYAWCCYSPACLVARHQQASSTLTKLRGARSSSAEQSAACAVLQASSSAPVARALPPRRPPMPTPGRRSSMRSRSLIRQCRALLQPRRPRSRPGLMSAGPLECRWASQYRRWSSNRRSWETGGGAAAGVAASEAIAGGAHGARHRLHPGPGRGGRCARSAALYLQHGLGPPGSSACSLSVLLSQPSDVSSRMKI